MSEGAEFNKRFYFDPESEESIIFQKLYLNAFDIDTFNEKIKSIEILDILNANDDSIRQVIRKIMTFNHHITGQDYYNIPTWSYIYKKGTEFCRVRKIDKSDIITPPSDIIKSCSDVWNPSVDKVTNYSRLNYPHESLLYTAHQYPEICIKETNITDQDRFALITYEAKEDILVTIVGYFQDNSAFTPKENAKIKVLTEFFFNQFTKEISAGEEYLYKVSSNIIKECYTTPDDSQDGWLYPSIALKRVITYALSQKLQNRNWS